MDLSAYFHSTDFYEKWKEIFDNLSHFSLKSLTLVDKILAQRRDRYRFWDGHVPVQWKLFDQTLHLSIPLTQENKIFIQRIISLQQRFKAKLRLKRLKFCRQLMDHASFITYKPPNGVLYLELGEKYKNRY